MGLELLDVGYAFMRYIAEMHSAEVKPMDKSTILGLYNTVITDSDTNIRKQLILASPNLRSYVMVLNDDAAVLKIQPMRYSSKPGFRHKIRKLEIPPFLMNTRLGQMAALLGAMGGGGMGLEDPYEKRQVLEEAREACKRPIEYRDKYEGKSAFTVSFHQDVLGNPAALLTGFVEYINNRNASLREQVGSNLALPISSVQYYLPPIPKSSDDKKK